MRLSIIVPTLDEAPGIATTLTALRPLRDAGHEVIVVDGGSRDATEAIARPLADCVITSPPGRARQMNVGACIAHGELLLFLHADTRLPAGAERMVLEGLHASGKGWGRFDLRLSGGHPLLRVIESMMNWRSRLTGIATGDQAIFIRRDWFKAAKGFPEIPLMEDIALSCTLKRRGPPLCLGASVVTSSRRWEEQGIISTILLMWCLRLLFFLGVDPARLVTRYYQRS